MFDVGAGCAPGRFFGEWGLLQKLFHCHSEQSEESFIGLILLALQKISPFGRNDKNGNGGFFVTGSMAGAIRLGC
jgi:hypothetical protein